MQKAVGTHIIIKVDRELQKSKSILSVSGLIAAPLFEYMQYNLQYGKIISVGEDVPYPEVQLGRQAIIHHLIESEDKYLIEELPNGDQIRWLDCISHTYSYKLFGVMDELGDIIPLPDFIFCHPEPEQSEVMQYEEMTFEGERLRFSTEKISYDKIDTEGKTSEGELYLAHLPTKESEKLYVRPVIAFVNPLETELQPGQKILAQDFTRYPVKLMDNEYWIISKEFIISIVNS